MLKIRKKNWKHSGKQLVHEMTDVKIKICGLYQNCDIDYANEVMPDYAGFVFYPSSHRYVEAEQMRCFRAALLSGIPAVGVFVDEPVEQAAAYVNNGLIQIAQLHGHEDEDYIEALRTLAPGCEIWKAFRIRTAEELKQAEMCSADKILLDNGYGTGKGFDWSLLEAKKPKRPFLLAGGLKGDNLEEAMERFHPWGVDLSSGVETDRKKDLQKMQQVVEIVRRNGKK